MSARSLRAGFYFDGYNVYHAVAELGQNHLKWFSYKRLSELIMQRGERIEFIKVFSAIALHFPASAARHRAFNAALASEGTQCILGQFKEKKLKCPGCKLRYVGHEEKETDVSIGIHLLNDCYQDRLDVAYIVTTDSDLAPAVRMVKQAFPRVELVTVSTPGRGHSFELANECHRKGRARTKMIASCLMPAVVKDALGKVVATRPREYAPPAPPR